MDVVLLEGDVVWFAVPFDDNASLLEDEEHYEKRVADAQKYWVDSFAEHGVTAGRVILVSESIMPAVVAVFRRPQRAR